MVCAVYIRCLGHALSLQNSFLQFRRAGVCCWTDLDKFVGLTGYVPEPSDVTVIEALRENASALSRLFAAITHRRTTSQLADTLFDKSVHAAWRREKCDIKKLAKKHQAVMVELQKAQQKCLDSNDNLVRISRAIDLQKLFVKHYQPKIERISKDIKKMEKECDRVVKKHAQNYEKFQKILDKENKCREELNKKSSSLADDIANKMAAAIGRLMQETSQNTSPEEIQSLARKVLQITSRLYRFKPPRSGPCGQEIIAAPKLRQRGVNRLRAVNS